MAAATYSAGVAWVPVSAWIAALVVALVVLGFCGYEISWKTRRLRTDVQRLQGLGGQLTEVAGRLADIRERVASAGLR